MRFSKKLLVLGLCSYSGALFGQATPVLTHPFQKKLETYSLIQGPQQHNRDDRPLKVLAPEALENTGLSPRFSLRLKAGSGLNLQGDNGIESVAYGFDLDSFPVCDSEVKIHRTQDGQTTMIGEFPPAPKGSFTAAQWAKVDAVHQIVDETFLSSSLGHVAKIVSEERCLLPQDGLKPVWKMVVETQAGLNYDVVADGNEVYRFDPRFFHAEGSAAVYPKNSVQTPIEAVSLREMDGTGLLANKYFQTCLPASSNKVICRPSESGSQYSFAQSDSFQFNYDPATDINKFIQASIFAHTNIALEWLEDHGYKNFGTTQIKLLPHAVFSNGDVNNALYQPGTSTTTPMILVGDGDGSGLQNLGTDGDVVSHELGHHVIFHSITTISGESLVLHEALADFFTFARTGDACLGESICPATSEGQSYCAVPRQCLRSGENELTFGSPNLPQAPHLRGQFISGMLWDMKEKDGIPIEDLTTMVLKGIDLLVYNSGYKHLVVALLLIDHSDFDDKYCSSILARAKARGLSSQLSDVTCEAIYSGEGTTLIPSSGGSSVTGPVTTTAKKSSKKSCGTLSGASSGQSSSLLLILSLPIALTLIRRKKS